VERLTDDRRHLEEPLVVGLKSVDTGCEDGLDRRRDLSAITTTQLERVLDDLQRGHSPSGRPLSGAAVNRYRARLSGMFKRAMKRGLVDRNPIGPPSLHVHHQRAHRDAVE
jgi:hypothetical protein